MQTWVLLRGLTRASAHWAGFDVALAQALSAQVIALDLPGNGSLWQMRSPSNVQAMAQHCRAEVLQRVGVQPVNLLAMSLGGMVATQWAASWPQQVRSMVLINTSMRPYNPPWQRLRAAALWQSMTLALRHAPPLAWEQAILQRTANHPQHDVVLQWTREREEHPVSGANALRQLLAAARYRAPAHAPTVPTLLLASAQDRLVHANCSAQLARHWSCPLHTHPTAGHDLTLDDSAWVLAHIRQLLGAP